MNVKKIRKAHRSVGSAILCFISLTLNENSEFFCSANRGGCCDGVTVAVTSREFHTKFECCDCECLWGSMCHLYSVELQVWNVLCMFDWCLDVSFQCCFSLSLSILYSYYFYLILPLRASFTCCCAHTHTPCATFQCRIIGNTVHVGGKNSRNWTTAVDEQ